MDENEKQDKKIDDLCGRIDKGLESKVSWIVFSTVMVVLLGLFGYFATADSSADAKIIKLNDKMDTVISENNKQFLVISTQLGEIKGALKIK
jgi:hypothetical protein